MSNKLSKKDLDILMFMKDCPSGITTTECLKIFGTTELRKVISKFRANGVKIKITRERHSTGWHNRYRIDETRV